MNKETDIMGMSSSQARLLTLTARMHDIEYKAQRIEAQKLQMANESRRVYEQYLDALDAKKIQYKGINSDGSITFRDASLRALENGAIPDYEGECSYKPFLLKNGMTDEIYITPEFAAYYGIDPDNMEPLGTLDEYLTENNVQKTKPIMETVTDYNNVLSVTPVQNAISSPYVEPKEAIPPEYSWNRDINRADPNNVHYSIDTDCIGDPGIVSVTEQNVFYNVNGYRTSSYSYNGSTNTLAIHGKDTAANLILLCTIGKNEDFINNEYDIDLITSWLDTVLTASDDGEYPNKFTTKAESYKFCTIINTLLENNDTSKITDVYNYISDYMPGGSKQNQKIDVSRLEELSGITVDMSGISISGIDFDYSGTTEGVGSYQNVVTTELITDVDYSNYSREDAIALIRETLANGKNILLGPIPNMPTMDEFMNNEYIQDILATASDFDIAKFAYWARNGNISYVSTMIDILLNGGSADSLPDPEGWDRERTTFHFSPTNKHLTKTVDYDGNAESIKNQLAYDLYEAISARGGVTTPEIMLGTANVYNNPQYLASLASYFGTDDWDIIIDKLSNSQSIDEYLHNFDGFDINFTGTEVLTWDKTEGQAAQPAQKGTIDIPTAQQIATNVIAAFGKNGANITEENYDSILNSIVTKLTSTSNPNLAEINAMVCEYLSSSSNEPNSNISALYNYVFSGGSLPSTSYYDSTKYDFEQKDMGECRVRYGTTQRETGDYTWDPTDPMYKEFSQKYYVLKSMEGSKYKIIDDEELLNSSEFVANWLTLNEGYLLEFDPKTQEMVDTNVAVNTNLQEVSDEKDLKKAEAKYEADMKRIDMKDRRYDTQLAALDNERNAVKQEMETVKTVAKDNVDRTFRLFS